MAPSEDHIGKPDRPGTGKLEYLQALRALAVTGVIVYHYPGGLMLGSRGYTGVDLFFVISGAIMVHTTRACDGSFAALKTFYLKRLIRIWPAYAIVSLFMLFLCHADRITHVVANLRWYIESLLFIPLWTKMPIDPPGWTLDFEMYFYFIFGLSLLGGTRRRLVFAAILFVTLLLIPHLCARFGIACNQPGDGIAGYGALITSSMIWNFAIGVGAGLVMQRRLRIANPTLTGALVTGCALGIAILYAELPILHGPRPWGLVFGLLVVLLDLHNNARPITVPRPILYIGDISYSLYLTHWIVEWVYATFIPVATMSPPWRIGLVVPYLAAILMLGALSYRTLERGLSEKLRRVLLPP